LRIYFWLGSGRYGDRRRIIMSMAKRQQDLKDPGVRARIAEQLRSKEDDEMSEQLKVMAEGEHVVLVAEGEQGKCEIRLNPEEADRFSLALDRAQVKASRAQEVRLSREAMKVDRVEEDDKDADG
jgi:hypothetical protein